MLSIYRVYQGVYLQFTFARYPRNLCHVLLGAVNFVPDWFGSKNCHSAPLLVGCCPFTPITHAPIYCTFFYLPLNRVGYQCTADIHGMQSTPLIKKVVLLRNKTVLGVPPGIMCHVHGRSSSVILSWLATPMRTLQRPGDKEVCHRNQS